MPIKYHDFDLLIERSGDGYKSRVIDSPAGEASTRFQLPFSPADVENFFIQIGHTRLIETSQMQKMRTFGQELFEATFTGNVRDKFRESLSEVNRNREGLRIRLRIENVPELANLPWEFLYDTSLSRFLTLSIETPLVRYLDVPRDIQPLTIRPPLRILAVISSPRDFPSLSVQREWDNLQEALNRLENRKLVHLTRLERPTLQALQRQLRRGEYHIFHFIGHGVFSKRKQDGQLLFEDELKGGDPVSSRDLGILLHDHRHLRLAVLNACEGARTSIEDQFSGTAQSLIRQGLPAVIAMQFRITDIAAITMAREFYAALADGYPVDASLTEARKSIKTHGNDLEWGTPVLYMRAPDGQIFDVESIPATTPIIAPAPKLTQEQIRQQEKIYTEALEAYYLEKWDVAFQKLQAVVDSNPDHKDAADKLEIAKRKVQLLNLHEKAAEAEAAKDWDKAIELLEALEKEGPTFENAKARLANARREYQLNDLYEEAHRLNQAEKWEAVLRVFSKIHSIDPKYPDTQGFRLKAEKQLAHTKRIHNLERAYNQALKDIDTGEWGKAIKSLKRVRKLQVNYRETERLLERANEEIKRIEKQKQKNEKVKSLYKQAENFLRRKQWQKSLEKVEEVLRLDPAFDDPKQIAVQARTELDKVKKESERQDQLAALYAEAVKANQAGEYQQALEKWDQIRKIDSKYPDRQRVYNTAQKVLKKTTQSESISEKIAWRPKFTPGWGILIAGILWYAIRLGALSITDLLEIDNSAVNQLLHWSVFGIATGFLNLFIYHFFEFDVSNKQKIILIGGWFVSSLATPMMVWLFPDFIFKYHIGYTVTGAFYGLVLHYTLPDFLYKPKFTTLIFSYSFGMFVGECSWSWFQYSADFNAQLTGAFALFTAIIVSSTLAFGKTIATHTDRKSKLTIEKAVLSIAGILIASRWLGSVIGENIANTILEPMDINWDTSPYTMTNLYFGLFAVFSIWFLIRFLKNRLIIPITKKEMITLAVSWISGMVAVSFLSWYLGVELEFDWGWKTGWGVGGLIIGIGMWLATKNYSLQSKSAYLLASIFGWGSGFFIGEQISWPIQSLFMHTFGEDFGWNIGVNANVGIAGLAGGLLMLGYLETGRKFHINWKTVLGAILGFGLGNLLVNIIFSSFDDELIINLIQLAIWGFIGGATLAFPSKSYKRYLLLGLLGSVGMAFGELAWAMLGEPDGLRALFIGAALGLCLGIGTKRTLGALMISLTGAVAYALRNSIYNIYYESDLSISSTMENSVLALSAGLMGLILGMILSFLNSEETQNSKPQSAE